MHSLRTRVAVPIGLGLVLFAAACGSKVPTASAPNYTAGPATLSARTIGGASVVVDKSGAPLYTNDQDQGDKSMCVSSECTAIWVPLTVPSGRQPSAAAGVSGALGTLQRADGTRQVTLAGKPLYTFRFDQGAGKVTGNGEKDSFGGTNFTWHSIGAGAGTGAGTTSAAVPPPANNPGGY